MWVLREIEGDGPHQVEQAQVHSMQLPSFYNFSTSTLIPCCTHCRHQVLCIWLGTTQQMSIRGCCKYFEGRQDGTSKASLAATGTVDGQSTCQFLVQSEAKDVVQENATTACLFDCRLPLALKRALETHWWSTSGKYLRQLPSKGYSYKNKKEEKKEKKEKKNQFVCYLASDFQWLIVR